ncbi:SWIM zinc finger family protein [Streptomyces sp. M1013]|uniref:SWIM zinc finger family protein n=1 Tax=Streptomyces sp. M1013 TaxID=549798 RepID=UPI00209B6FAE|nr:SWIM zinc finger family protein [Streptomyces sp. M1013]
MGAGAARPADVAREALRAARRKAKADAASEGGASAESAAHARRSSRPAGRQRRADGSDTADVRARAVRDFAAGAFRLPPETDPAEEAPPAGESAGGSAPGDRAAAYPEPDPSPGADPAAGAAPTAPEAAAVTDAEGRAAAHRHPDPRPEPDSSPGADPAAGTSPTSRGAAPAPRPEGPGPGAEWSRHPQRSSVAPGADPAAGAAPTDPEAAAATDAEGRAAAHPRPEPHRHPKHPHPEPDSSPGADPAAGTSPTSRGAAPAPRPEGPGPGAEWSRHPQRSSMTPGADPAAGAAPTSPEAAAEGRAAAHPHPHPHLHPEPHPHPHPEPDSAPGADPAAGTPPTSPGAEPVPHPEGPGPGVERSRRPRQQPAAVRGRAFADATAPPARPRAPRSMAAPERDGDLRRTFPALPRRAADEGFAGTWWGNAWVTALEEGALDAARLERGRGYAERGHVDAITVTPGLVLAYVQGSRARPYRVQVRLRTLGDADWDRFLDAAVERPGHIAALLDKELPHSLADLAVHGVPLLPGPGDLTPQCSCPDSGHPCKHAAALCYQTARLLDADPFVLLLLRGRGERALLDALSRRNAARAARVARAARAAQDRGPAPLPGVRAGEALTPRALPPLPAPLPAPPHPEQPPAYPAAPGGPDPFALDQLATDAAARAHALLTTGRDPVGGLTLWQDAVRLAAARPGSGLTAGTRALYASLASAAGRDTAELARAVAAWRQGGPEGLDVLEEPWDPPAGRFDRARPLLLAADLPAFRPWRNHLTHPRGHVQLRLGRAGLWYAYESEPGREDWWPRGTPDLDPVGALTGLGTRVDL